MKSYETIQIVYPTLLTNLDLYKELESLKQIRLELEKDIETHNREWVELNDSDEDDHDDGYISEELNRLDQEYLIHKRASNKLLALFNEVEEEYIRRNLDPFYTYEALEKAGQLVFNFEELTVA